MHYRSAKNRGDVERRSPTGIARERETRADDPPPCQSVRAAPSPHRMPPPLPEAAPWSAGLRPASRGSAKPAPMTLRHAKVRAAPSPHRMPPPLPEAAPFWSAGLRPASRGSAKPAPMTLRPANLSAARSQPRIARPLPAPRPRDPLSLASGIPISVTRVRGSEQTPGDGGDSHYVVSRTGVGYNSDSEETPY